MWRNEFERSGMRPEELRNHLRELRRYWNSKANGADSKARVCRQLLAADEESLRARGALVFPAVPDVPFDAYRATLYSPWELYDGLATSYEDTFDATVYAWSQQEAQGDISPAQALHDHAIDDALREGNDSLTRDELGDVLLQVLFHSVVAEQRGAFDAHDVAAALISKMRARHPHLYGGGEKQPWEKMKAARRSSIAEGLPVGPHLALGDQRRPPGVLELGCCLAPVERRLVVPCKVLQAHLCVAVAAEGVRPLADGPWLLGSLPP